MKLNLKTNIRYCWIAGSLLLPCAVLMPLSFHTGGQKIGNSSRVNNSSAMRERIVNEVEPLCRALVPDHDMLRFQVTPMPVYSLAGAAGAFWVVECFNAANKEMVHAIWNDNTKKMFSMSLISSPNSARSVSPTQDQAGASARRWLTHLNMVSQIEALSSPGKTARLGTVWRVDLRLTEGRAIVWINACSGALEHIMVREGQSVFARTVRHSIPAVALHTPRSSDAALPHRAIPILPPAGAPDA